MRSIAPTIFGLCMLAFGLSTASAVLESRNTTTICQQLAKSLSPKSEIIYPLDLLTYEADIEHWFLTSTQSPTCVLEAGSTEDVSKAIKIIGKTRTPFAVYSGGHASNPGFSSTPGVHISFQRMTQVVVSADSKTVKIGMGQNWASVYKSLDSTSVNVVGGRVEGPGVGGFTLGGGYSWLTNQYGLTCDTVKSFTLVLPNGTITNVDASQEDLFFALKGGLNRFGIVTQIEYFAVPQVPNIYAGIKIYAPKHVDEVIKATHKFLEVNKDPKAQVITTLSGGAANGTSALVLFFYDGPTPPSAFAPFAKIPSLIDTLKQQSFSSFVSGVPSKIILNARGTFNSLSTTTLTPKYLAAISDQLNKYGNEMLAHSATMLSMDVEPFLSNWGHHATESAYPHSNSPLPLNLYFAWTLPSDDQFWYDAMRDIVAELTAVAMAENIYVNVTYPNYAITGTTATQLYGAANAKRLARIRAEVDPQNVMSLAGGFDV